MPKPIINRLGATHQETKAAVDRMVAKMRTYPLKHSLDELGLAMLCSLPELAGRVPDAVFHAYVVITAALATHGRTVPKQPVPDTVDVLGYRVAAEVMQQIDSFYPTMWATAPATARLSLRDTIRDKVAHYVCLAMEQSKRQDGTLVLTEKQVTPDADPAGAQDDWREARKRYDDGQLYRIIVARNLIDGAAANKAEFDAIVREMGDIEEAERTIAFRHQRPGCIAIDLSDRYECACGTSWAVDDLNPPACKAKEN